MIFPMFLLQNDHKRQERDVASIFMFLVEFLVDIEVNACVKEGEVIGGVGLSGSSLYPISHTPNAKHTTNT
jgi:hypothetical protein